MALEVHKSVVNPRDTRSSFTVLMMSVISFITSSALLSTILESEVGCFTFTFLVRTLISLWKLSPYWWKDVQVSVMCSMRASSNFSWSYLSTWWTCGLKKSSLGFLLALPSPDSGFLFCPWRARSSFLESSSWKNAIANPKLNLFQPWQALGGRLQGGAKAHWCCHRCKRSLCNTSCTLLFHLEAFRSIAS